MTKREGTGASFGAVDISEPPPRCRRWTAASMARIHCCRGWGILALGLSRGRQRTFSTMFASPEADVAARTPISTGRLRSPIPLTVSGSVERFWPSSIGFYFLFEVAKEAKSRLSPCWPCSAWAASLWTIFRIRIRRPERPDACSENIECSTQWRHSDL